MSTLTCKRCLAPFPGVMERNDHQMNCVASPPKPEPKRPNPGRRLEERIEKSAKALAAQGLKLKHHRPHNPRGTKIWLPAPVDFTGDLGGRAVAFDAKSADGTTLAISDLQKRQHQIDEIRASHARGAVAFYLVELRGAGPRYFALTWPVLEPFLAGTGRRSITLDVFAARCPEVARHGPLLDLVAAIKAVAS